MNAKYICFFNHKGGVSKTTTAFHLGWKLTDLDRRVLLVDTDAQCNLTGLVLGRQLNAHYSNPHTQADNIFTALSGVFQGNAISPGRIHCPSHLRNRNLFLIPGHPDISIFENQLCLALTGTATFMSQQNQPGALYALIEQCCQANQIDYVIIDMNPALSSLNKVFFSLCDGFVVPTVPDPFCLMALKSLTRVLPSWKRDINTFIGSHPSAVLKLPSKQTCFIGEIIQRYSLRNQNPSKSYESIISEIKAQIQNVFVPAMAAAGMAFSAAAGRQLPPNTGKCIAQMPEFLSLLQKATGLEKPVFALLDSEIGSGAILHASRKKRDSINSSFTNMAQLILTLLP